MTAGTLRAQLEAAVRLAAPKADYVADPPSWFRDRLGEEIWSKQAEIMASVRDNKFTAVPSGHGAGKALRLDEPLPTPTGWVANGDVRAGDELIGEDGQPVRVTWVSETQVRPSYRLTFSDGTQVDCSDEHEWAVLDLTARSRRVGARDWRDHWDSAVTYTAQQLFKLGVLTTSGQCRWRVPTVRPLDLPTADLPLDPYVLGVWLADGGALGQVITLSRSTKAGVADELRARGEVLTEYATPGDGVTYGVRMLGPRLRQMGLVSAKHIPARYLRASTAQRLDLLRGIMDGDGFRTGRGQTVGIDQTDQRLAADIAELATSLGWSVRTGTGAAAYTLGGVRKVTGTRWRMNWRPDVDVFLRRDPRPVEDTAQASRHTVRTITAIEPVEPVPMRCLAVDSPRSLFLAGRSMVPTHNSHLGGRAICWFVDTHTAGETFVISTAPAAAQVSAILWKEVGRAHRKARERAEKGGTGHGFGGKINTAGYPQWKMHDGPDGLVGYGRKPADYSESSFQGIHAPEGVLIVVDEAAGISRSLMQQVDSIATTDDCRVLLIGNPTDPASYFAEACKPGSKYHVIRIDILRTPLFTRKAIEGRLPLTQALMEAESVPYSTEVVPPSVKGLTPPSWVEECLQDWCTLDPVALAQLEPEERREQVRSAAANSPVFTARVRALFPDTDHLSVIPLHWVEAAMVRWEDWKAGDPAAGIEPEAEPAGRRVVGVDVAREGGDSTAIAIRQGHVVQKILVHQKEDTMRTVARVRPWLDHPQAMAVVDTVGIGAGVYDRLRELHTKKEIHGTSVGFVAGAQSHRTDRTGKYRFRNDRMAAWWNLRELLDPAFGSRICLPRSDSLMAQLTTPRWWILEGSPTIIVETKDELKKRLKRSPDEADACFPAGTLITTARGQLPIQQVRPGDLAWTRVGWRPVLVAAMTSNEAELLTVELADGRTLTGTPNHPVWDGRAFRRLDSFTDADSMTLWQPSTSPTEGSRSGATPTASTGTSASTTGRTAPRPKLASALSTSRSTAQRWGRFLTAGTSTTATSTRWTTALRTCRRYLLAITSRSTPGLMAAGETTVPSTWHAAASWPGRGTRPRRAARGTASSANCPGRSGSDSRSAAAMDAGPRSLRTCRPQEAVSVAGVVGPATPATSTNTPRSTATAPYARNAGGRSLGRLVVGGVFVAVGVRRSYASGRSAVWNLQVQGQPEYLANGILVHNCVMAFWFTGAPPVSADVPAGQPLAWGGDGLPVDGVVAYPPPPPETWGGDTWADEDGVIGYPAGQTW